MPGQAETIPDRDEFARSTERFRRELLAHCYRMLVVFGDPGLVTRFGFPPGQ